MTVNGTVTPSVSIGASPGSSICAGTNVTFTATPTNGGTTPSYQWKVNGSNVGSNSATYSNSTLSNSDVVTCEMTSNATCASPTTATSSGITMTVTPTVTPSVSISSGSGTTICTGQSVTFTATPTNGGTTPSYQWKVNGSNVGTNSNTYTTSTLTNGQTVTCVMTSNATCASPTTATSSGITMTVTSTVTPSVSISSTDTTICTGQSVTFTPTPTNGGTSPTYQWKVNGSNVATGSTYTTSSLTNGQTVTCEMTSNSPCASPTTATSNSITMVVTPTITPSVSISSTDTTICSGTSVTFTAVPTNGGTTPSYQWKVNGSNVGTNSNTYTSSSLSNGQTVTCVMTSNDPCASPTTATSSGITMVVTPSVTPSVSISSGSGTTICSGTSVTFTAIATNGGAGPSYQWKINGSNVGTNSTSFITCTLSNGDAVTCEMTSNATCASPTTATSNTVNMTVNPTVTPSVSISSGSGTSICTGQSVTFTAVPTNGGTTPSYQWKVNGSNVGTNSSTYTTSSLTNGQTVTCEMTSNATCATPTTATSSGITMTVSSTVTPSVSISSGSGTSICTGASVTFTAVPTNGGTSPSYQWKVNGRMLVQ